METTPKAVDFDDVAGLDAFEAHLRKGTPTANPRRV
jgi:hypothetical protein